MRNLVLIVIVLATALLAACNKSSSAPSAAPSSPAAPSAMATPPANPQDGGAVSQKLHDLAGSGATDCGHLASQAPDQLQKASECAMNAAKEKHPFLVAYDMPGLSVGVAGTSQGKLYSVQAEQVGSAPPSEVKSAPCPAELRIAQSGRVTCMSPGSMGGSGASPHGGMPPATGANPHGGGMMSMPDLGGKGTAKSSHPPAKTSPPQQ